MATRPLFTLATIAALSGAVSVCAQTAAPTPPQTVENDVADPTSKLLDSLDSAMAAATQVADSATLGVAVDRISDEVRATVPTIKPGVGLAVRFVASESPAAAAKVEAGDILIRLGEHPLVHPEQLRVLLLAAFKPGEEVDLAFIHQGQSKQAKVTLARTAPQPPVAEANTTPFGIQGFVVGPDGRAQKLWDGKMPDVSALLKEAGIDEKTVQEALRELEKIGILGPARPDAAPGDSPNNPAPGVPSEIQIPSTDELAKLADRFGVKLLQATPGALDSGGFMVISPTGEMMQIDATKQPELARSIEQLFKKSPTPPAPDR